MSQVSLSHCGHYVALVEDTNISIHRILPSFLLRRYNAAKDIRRHLKGSGSSDRTIKIGGLFWETTTGLNTSTKIAVSISSKDFHATIVYDMTSQSTDPVIIELDSAIAHISWIEGAPEEGSAYKNCTQLVVFDLFGLLARVYSLDCTRVLFTVPKPIVQKSLTRPGHPGFWSLLLTSYFDKNLTSRSIMIDLQSDSHPYLLHFTNNGSRSALFASLQLDHQSSPSAQIAWDPKGSWICFFDSGESLFGYTVRVYNSLGVYQKSENSDKRLAQPTLHSSYTKGIGWTFAWLNIHDLLFIAAIPLKSYKKLEFRIHGVSHLSLCYPSVVHLEKSDSIWVLEGFDGDVSYRRTDVCPESSFEWKLAKDSGKYLVLATNSVVVILRRSSEGPLVKFEPEAYISSLHCHDIQFFNDSIILLFRELVAIYTEENLSILATSRYSLLDMRITNKLGAPVMTLVERTPQGEVWRQVEQEAGSSEDSSLLLLNNLSYREDNSKVVNLVKEAQKNDWGKNAKRRLTEDTDTFKLNFKRRRPPGLPELR